MDKISVHLMVKSVLYVDLETSWQLTSRVYNFVRYRIGQKLKNFSLFDIVVKYHKQVLEKIFCVGHVYSF
jgi:hypothetical protein